jgi:polyhydroxybutyrate depolymerase
MRCLMLGWALLLGGCATPGVVAATLLPDDETVVDDPSEIDSGGATELAVGTPERPAVVALPEDRSSKQPLVVLLHGYGLPPAYLDEYLGMRELTRARGMYLLLPESKTDSVGLPYWNATDACCDFDRSDIDDVAALSAVIDKAVLELPIDETRIYLVGHSNGGFMAYRMACEHSERFAGIAVLAGADYLEPNQCEPSEPVSVLHLHGNADSVVSYNGGRVPSVLAELKPFPDAATSVQHYADRAHCEPTAVEATSLDLTNGEIDGAKAETSVFNFSGCDSGIDVALWTLRGADHQPDFRDGAFGAVLDWLSEHHR